MAAYWRTNPTVRQPAPLFGISKSAADRIVDYFGPALALQPCRRYHMDTVLIVDGTLVPTRDHTVAEQSKNYRCSIRHQVIIDADTRLVVAVGRSVPDNRNACKTWEISGAALGCDHLACGRGRCVAVDSLSGVHALVRRAA